MNDQFDVTDNVTGNVTDNASNMSDKLDLLLRGRFLIKAISIFSLLDDTISYYFCDNEAKRRQFILLILRHIEYGEKIQSFSDILHSSYGDLLKEYPDLIHQLKSIYDFYKILTTGIIETNSYDHGREKVNLIYEENGTSKTLEINVSLIDERIQDSINLHFDLSYIKLEIKERSFDVI